MKINSLISKLQLHRLKIGIALLVFILLIASILFAIWWNQQQTLKSPGNDPEVTQQLENAESRSPDGNHTAQLTGTSDNPILEVDGNQIESGVAYFKWGKDGYVYYVKSISPNSAQILRRLPGLTAEKLIDIAGETAGFDFLNNALIYTTHNQVGVYKLNSKQQIVVYKFNPPTLGADEEFIPDIIPDEDGGAATVTIYDQDYLNNGKVIYLVVNASGQITNKTESVAF